MKNYYLLIFLTLSISFPAIAQITKGNWLFGGTIGFSSDQPSNDYGKQTTTIIQVMGNAGYFLKDKLATGLRPNLYFENLRSDFADTRTQRTSIGPFIRYYLLPDDQRVNLFVDGNYVLGRNHISGSKGFTTHGYSLSAGPSLFLNSAVALELTLSYSQFHSNDVFNTKRKIFQAGIGLQFHLEKE